MRRLGLQLFFLLISISVFADVQVIKQTIIAPQQNGVFHVNLAVSGNPETGENLVLWTRRTNTASSLQGRRVNSQGNPIGGIINLSRMPGASNGAVAFNPVLNEYCLAFDDNLNNSLGKSNVFFARLNTQGRPKHQPVNISNDAVSSQMTNLIPRITVGSDGTCYVFWQREISDVSQINQGNNGLVGLTIPPGEVLSAAALDPPSMIRKTMFDGRFLLIPFAQRTVYNPATQKIHLVVFQGIANSQAQRLNYFLGTINEAGLSGRIHTAAIKASFSKINGAPVVAGENTISSDIAFSSSGEGLVAFVDSKNMKVRAIGTNGKLSGPPAPAFNEPARNKTLAFPAIISVGPSSSTSNSGIGIQNSDVDYNLAAIEILEQLRALFWFGAQSDPAQRALVDRINFKIAELYFPVSEHIDSVFLLYRFVNVNPDSKTAISDRVQIDVFDYPPQ